MTMIVVEHQFEPALNLSRGLPTANALGGPCLPIYNVAWRSTYFACDGTQAVCVYDAPDAETVRRAYRAAGAQFVAVWSAEPTHRHKEI
jgi:hypothetical protein